MGKLFIVALAVFGAYIAIGIFFPSLMRDGFAISGHTITYGLIVLGGVGYLAFKAK